MINRELFVIYILGLFTCSADLMESPFGYLSSDVTNTEAQQLDYISELIRIDQITAISGI